MDTLDAAREVAQAEQEIYRILKTLQNKTDLLIQGVDLFTTGSPPEVLSVTIRAYLQPPRPNR
jgi:hypothetical protein